VKHIFSSGKADGADATLVQPSNWNDVHIFGGRSLSANTNISLSDDLILATGGAGGITLTLPTPVGNTWHTFTFQRVDSAAGGVTVTGTGLTYVLTRLNEVIVVFSDGTNWQLLNYSTAGATGTALLNFGTFPGSSDASVAITGQSEIVASSIVQAWIYPAATADHTADEHIVEEFVVSAGNIVAGTGFTIYGVSQIPPSPNDLPLIYGQWSVAWRWS
jgi:hypothetical protein